VVAKEIEEGQLHPGESKRSPAMMGGTGKKEESPGGELGAQTRCNSSKLV